MNARRMVIASAIVLLGGGLALALPGLTRLAQAPARHIPTARVQRGRVDVTVYTIGELRAGRAAQLIAPPIGGNLTIVKFAPSGEPAKANDVIVEFDSAEQSFALEQARFDLAQAEQEIAKADAAAQVQIAQDDVALLHAKYDVRRSELDVLGNELEGAIKAQQNVLLLDEARQRLTQLEKDVQSHRETTRAAGNVLKEKRAKAELAVQVAERNIASLQMRAPFDGFVVSRQNTDALGGFCCPPGITLPDYRVGDSVGSGRTLADVIDTSSIEVSAKVNEQDRANVSAGQAIELAVDTLPDAKLRGSVRTVSGVASRQMWWASDSTRKFDVIFEVAGDPRVRPGATAQIKIAGPALENVLYIPRQAVFDNAGRATVYVKSGDAFDARDVKVKAWTDSLAVVESLEPGTEVALVNPSTTRGARPKAPPPPTSQRASR